jgi:gamma-glutamyltranspeptidase
MTADGKPPAAGQLQRNPDLAATFRRLAEHGAAKGEAGHAQKASKAET